MNLELKVVRPIAAAGCGNSQTVDEKKLFRTPWKTLLAIAVILVYGFLIKLCAEVARPAEAEAIERAVAQCPRVKDKILTASEPVTTGDLRNHLSNCLIMLNADTLLSKQKAAARDVIEPRP
jgi:hypothetical protein